MPTHYVIKARTNYRPWWAPWRARQRFEYRVWQNGRRIDDIFHIEVIKSTNINNLSDRSTEIKLNDQAVESAEFWVDGCLHARVPDPADRLAVTYLHAAGGTVTYGGRVAPGRERE